jgi:pilus assembly protein CpaD
MLIMIRFLRLATLGLLAASAAGCTMPLTNGEMHARPASERFPITVEPRVMTMAVNVDDGLQRLAPGEDERVLAFAERWKARGQGLINAAVPEGSSNEATARSGLDQVRALLDAGGVSENSVTVTSYRAGNDPRAPITLSFVTYAASAPDCGTDWSVNLGYDPRNTGWPEFGCSTQHNLAAAVANPRDLVEPHTTDPADAQRRSVVMEKYRAGTATESARGSDSSGRVSSVGTN